MRKEHGPPEFQGGVHLASWLGLLTAAHSSNDILAFDPRILPPAAGCARRTATFWSGPSDGFPLDGLSNQSGRRVAIASRPHDSRSDSTSSRRAACCWLLWEEYPAPARAFQLPFFLLMHGCGSSQMVRAVLYLFIDPPPLPVVMHAWIQLVDRLIEGWGAGRRALGGGNGLGRRRRVAVCTPIQRATTTPTYAGGAGQGCCGWGVCGCRAIKGGGIPRHPEGVWLKGIAPAGKRRLLCAGQINQCSTIDRRHAVVR